MAVESAKKLYDSGPRRTGPSGAGHGEKLSRKAHHAIAALLSHATLGEAAEAVGVSQTTLWRWLQREDFRRQLREAQGTVFDAALTTLQSSTNEAVSCLRRNLNCKRPSVEVRAAGTLLKYSLKAYEMFDLQTSIHRT